MRESTPNNYKLKELQNVILNVAYDIDVFCDKYKIDYFLMGGSALGARRHEGFIPWDDDLDLFMTPDNYDKFKSFFEKFSDKEKYYLQELGASSNKIITAKIRLNNSFYGEDILKGWKIHHGIFVDIFILHTSPNNLIKRGWQYFWAKYLIAKGLANKRYKRRGKIIYMILLLMSILPKRFLLNFGLKQVYKYRNCESNYYCNFFGRTNFKNGVYNKEWFAKIKRVPFETITLNTSTKDHSFLYQCFGNYMEYPSKEEIMYEQHASDWGLGNYVYTDLSDEKYLF